ncbi:MAG: CelD/BcsL family acetyltransferase involved in cellulose biosynthesis [Glaciecola sp.]|jgi:CelD/BcsL family acetyltransferase involved in cellulose biosynthesis
MLTQIFKSYEIDYVKSLLPQVTNSEDSIFLSEFWLLPWLETLTTKPILIVCQRDSQILGLAFWGCQKHWLGDNYYLNQTGLHSEDQVWIEQNDIICRSQDRPEVLEAMLEKLCELKSFAKVTVQTCLSAQWQHTLFLEPQITQETNFYADLKVSSNYLDSLSKNTRASIRRSNKLIEDKFGPITVNITHPNEHPDLLNKISQLHILKWGTSEYGSGFTNSKFVEFHEQLLGIRNKEYSDKAKLLTIAAGDFILGYLYILISDKHILFYLSAINYADLGNKYKPGLTMHSYAIEYFKNLGYDNYDFLAGPARYKEQMSNNSYPVYHISMYKKTYRNRLLTKLKSLLKR